MEVLRACLKRLSCTLLDLKADGSKELLCTSELIEALIDLRRQEASLFAFLLDVLNMSIALYTCSQQHLLRDL